MAKFWVPGALFAAGVTTASAWTLWRYSRAGIAVHPIGIPDIAWMVLNARADLSPGGLQHMYAGNGGFMVALPGYQLILVTVIRVVTWLGFAPPSLGSVWLHGGWTGANYFAGSAWNIVIPVALAAGFAALFPFDALVRRCGIGGLKRVVVLLALAVTLWWVIVWWTHPEDAVAMGLLCWSCNRILDRQWRGAGWLLGLAIATQTVAVLAVPLVFAIAGVRRWPKLVIRCVVPGALAVAIPLLGDPTDTIDHVVRQPAWPLNPHVHLTPWIALAARPHPSVAYAAWSRSIALAAAVGLAYMLVRRWGSKDMPPTVLCWGVGCTLALRCIFEPVMVPYYIALPVLFLLVAISGRRWWRLGFGAAIAAALSAVTTQHGLGEWPYWMILVVGFALLAWLGLPQPPAQPRQREESDSPTVTEPATESSATPSSVLAELGVRR